MAANAVATAIKVGLVDSALAAGCAGQFSRYHCAEFNPQLSSASAAHGSAVCARWAELGENIELYNAVLFDDSLRCQQAHLVAALNWLLECQVATIHMSLGVRQPSAELTAVCAQLAARGTLLVASAPAQGAPVYPAQFDGVISATGDARCQPGQLSQLVPVNHRGENRGPQFGGCVYSDQHSLRGASIGAGAVTAQLLKLQIAAEQPLNHTTALSMLAAGAHYRGREQRSQPAAGGRA